LKIKPTKNKRIIVPNKISPLLLKKKTAEWFDFLGKRA
jgi:hypothetical protein